MGKVVRSQNLSGNEKDAKASLESLFASTPIPSGELLSNLGLYIKRQDLMRILFISELYQKMSQVPGDVYEFGVRWGQNLALFSSMRGIVEPYNFTRRIFGFDTFDGFVGVAEEDGEHDVIFDGAYGVTPEYEQYLHQVLDVHQSFSPIEHIKRFELIKGDAQITVPAHLESYPESIVALAYFDFDIYQPTVKVLEAIQERLVKGSIIAFDEINHATYPGETVALRKVLGLNALPLKRSPFSSTQAYYIYE